MPDGNSEGVNYQPIANDPARSCIKCKHFQPTEDNKGECFGHEVSSKATCNYFEVKEAIS